ncbi:DMSO/selenate family reductase complex B subunit [Salipaludibacillus daqingensis]|uniref:DMSO/selenate family reductase complex B subunit n=1 Tax=Salipaludibacillus daqingensis TaxID=3041001 RepID=UPI002473FD66|nr:DMSO/selenate family reductase complex B subunit [Salipaludibacillus daqingensis]
MGQKGFYIDSTVCSGCKVCSVSCKDVNDLKVGVNYRRVYEFEGGRFPDTWGFFLSVSCNHCDEPKCAENCPTGAIYKRTEDGLVVHDDDKCVGCKMCLWSCPYEGPQYNRETGKAGKCDGCVDLVDEGQKPACVDACVMRALDFGDMEELRAKYGDGVELKVFADKGITHPNVIVNAIPEAEK